MKQSQIAMPFRTRMLLGIFREVKGLPEPTDTTGFTHSEKVAESVTFNEDGSYSSTLNGPSETDIWKGIGEVNAEKDDSYSIGESSQSADVSNADHQSADVSDSQYTEGSIASGTAGTQQT